jgi:hypothetical protein
LEIGKIEKVKSPGRYETPVKSVKILTLPLFIAKINPAAAQIPTEQLPDVTYLTLFNSECYELIGEG